MLLATPTGGTLPLHTIEEELPEEAALSQDFLGAAFHFMQMLADRLRPIPG